MNFLFNLATNSAEWKGKVVVIYDGECPFCSRYVRFQRLRETLANVALVDARTRPDLVQAFEDAGTPLDIGMALIMDGRVYHGADCMNRLALMSSSNRLFNRVNAVVFASPTISRLLYPVLRNGRNLALKLMGRSALRDGI